MFLHGTARLVRVGAVPEPARHRLVRDVGKHLCQAPLVPDHGQAAQPRLVDDDSGTFQRHHTARNRRVPALVV